jgi:hypothetical protein
LAERGLADYLEEMTMTDGWQAVEAWIKERIAALEGTLLRGPLDKMTLEMLRETRLQIDTLRSVPSYVERTIEEGREERLQRRPP